MRLQFLRVEARESGEPVTGERLAEHGGVLEEPSLGRLERVEPRRGERLKRLRNRERLDRARGPVLVAAALQESAVEQHSHGLDRVERDAVGLLDDPLLQLGR